MTDQELTEAQSSADFVQNCFLFPPDEPNPSPDGYPEVNYTPYRTYAGLHGLLAHGGSLSRTRDNRDGGRHLQGLQRETALYDVSLFEDLTPGTLLRTPLWSQFGMPDDLRKSWSRFADEQGDVDEWRYWIKWYQGLLDGTDLDPDFLRQVSRQIPLETWRQGPEPVGRRIDELQLRAELKGQNSLLKGELEAGFARNPMMGHNNPPFSTAEAENGATQVTLLWEQISDLEKELNAKSPNVGLLQKILNGLRELAEEMLRDKAKAVINNAFYASLGAMGFNARAIAQYLSEVVRLLEQWLIYLVAGL